MTFIVRLPPALVHFLASRVCNIFSNSYLRCHHVVARPRALDRTPTHSNRFSICNMLITKFLFQFLERSPPESRPEVDLSAELTEIRFRRGECCLLGQHINSY